MAKDQFYELFLCELRDIYSTEKQLISALPKFIEKASDPNLREALQMHFTETKQQFDRLDKIFHELNEAPNDVTSPAIEGLIREGDALIEKFSISAIRDAAIITIAQRIEHYEIAVYGALRTFANQLDYNEIENLLQESLNEKGNANKKLTDLAKGGFFTSGINQKALNS